jgi:hypothetical protein
MKSLYLVAVVAIANGCSTFSTTQSDEREDINGKMCAVKTQVRATSFFASRSALSGWHASQTEKTQGASITGLVVDSNAGTNLNAIVGAVVEAAVKAAIKP